MKLRKLLSSIIINTSICIFLLINFAPLIIALSSSFRPMNYEGSPLRIFEVLSLQSYQTAFKKMGYFTALGNSMFLTTVSVVMIVTFASMAAYPMARVKTRASRFFSNFFLAGLVVPGQLSLIPIYIILSKLMILKVSYAAPIIMFVTCSLPFSTFLYTGFIRGSIPYELEEAALLDGVGLFKRFWKIVFPLLIPATVAVIITQSVWIWNDFFMPMLFIGKKINKPLPLVMLSFMGDKENPTQWNGLFAACYLCAIPLLLAFSFMQKYFLSGLTLGAVKG